MTPDLSDILAASDAGEFPAAIATRLGCSAGHVYGVLRQHRPGRARKPRRRTSEKPEQIRALYLQEIEPLRIAFLLQCSRAYVYRHLKGLL